MDLKIFIALTAVALVAQVGIGLAMVVGLRKTIKKIDGLKQDLGFQAALTVTICRSIVADVRPKLETTKENVAAVKILFRSRVKHLNGAIEGTLDRIAVQVTHAEDLISKTKSRVEGTTESIHRIVTPIRGALLLFRVLRIYGSS